MKYSLYPSRFSGSGRPGKYLFLRCDFSREELSWVQRNNDASSSEKEYQVRALGLDERTMY